MRARVSKDFLRPCNAQLILRRVSEEDILPR